MSSQLHNNLQHSLHPGSEHTDLYPVPDDKDFKKQKRKNTFLSRFIYPFPSLSFGSQSILVTVNNLDMLADTYLMATFDNSGTSTLRALPMFNLFTRIDYIFNNSQMVTVNSRDLFLYMLDSVEDTGKKEEILALAGGNGGNITAPTTYYCPLYFPWSSVRSGNKRTPIDLSQLNAPVKIMFYLNTASNIYSANPPASNSLVRAQIMCRQGQLSDASERLNLGDKHLVYNHSYLQSFSSSPFQPATTSTVNTVYATGYRSGDLLGMLIRAVDVSKLGQTEWEYNTLSDLVIKLNGNTLIQMDAESYKIANLFHGNTANKITLGGVSYYYIHINFSHYANKEVGMGATNLQYGINLSNQQIELSFKSSSTNNQQLLITYVYNGSIVVGGGSAEVVV